MQRESQFGSWLKERRKALDLTQAELASQVGCAVVTVKKIETAVQRPSKQMAERIALVLAIPPAEQAAFVAFARGVSETPPGLLPPGTEADSPHHLPSPPTAFVGRSRELDQLEQLLDDPACRLVTLVGSGGMGKTRLALEAAHRYSDRFLHGAHFVSLEPVSSPDSLLFAVGSVLEFSFDGQQAPIDQLTNLLHDKTLLILLDSFEHLLDAAPLIGELLHGAPRLKLLITSRERLNLQGEWALPIVGMDYPQGNDQNHVETYSAIQLFVQAARRAQPGFSLNSDAPAVLRICQLVEGMPLAIELAAPWVRLLTCLRIAERLEANLDFLSSSTRSVPERHRSLRAVFDYSWSLLSSAEQTALARLSVFRNGFDLEAAEVVGEASLQLIAGLADKSLLRGDGAGRYALHELLRQYASEQLARQAFASDHRAQAIDYLTQAAERAVAHRQAAALLGQAIAIAEEVGHLALLGQLHYMRGRALLKVSMWIEARPDLEAVLRLTEDGDPDRRVETLLELSDVSFFLHDLVGQRQYTEEALLIAETAMRSDLAVAAMTKQGLVETNDGKLKAAVSIYERAIALGGKAHYDLGRTLYWQGRYAEALPHLRQAVELAQDDEIAQIWPLEDLGLVLVATGQYAEAVAVYNKARQLSQEHQIWPALARSVANLGGLHLEVFDFVGSEALAEEARELARSADFVLAEVSAGLDLLFNFARRRQPERIEKLLPEVAAAVEKAGGSHGWLWKLRFAQAQAELALARHEWGEALRLADTAIQYSQDRSRVKYEVLGLKTRGQALVALGRIHEAAADLRNALALARFTGDPALFLQVAAVLLAVEDDDPLAVEARTTVQRINAALPNDEMRLIFQVTELVQQLTM
ncbi:MAG: tetratricopeptide repeat protein [Anaerolineae bacterium]|nr:tetratricopeptide repeat protein [Anaerolineae bacterium]